jgi:hypothetical protein
VVARGRSFRLRVSGRLAKECQNTSMSVHLFLTSLYVFKDPKALLGSTLYGLLFLSRPHGLPGDFLPIDGALRAYLRIPVELDFPKVMSLHLVVVHLSVDT